MSFAEFLELVTGIFMAGLAFVCAIALLVVVISAFVGVVLLASQLVSALCRHVRKPKA